MLKITQTMRSEGEMLARRLSKKAQVIYYGADQLTILARDRDANDGIWYRLYDGEAWQGTTFDELQTTLETIADEIAEDG